MKRTPAGMPRSRKTGVCDFHRPLAHKAKSHRCGALLPMPRPKGKGQVAHTHSDGSARDCGMPIVSIFPRQRDPLSPPVPSWCLPNRTGGATAHTHSTGEGVCMCVRAARATAEASGSSRQQVLPTLPARHDSSRDSSTSTAAKRTTPGGMGRRASGAASASQTHSVGTGHTLGPSPQATCTARAQGSVLCHAPRGWSPGGPEWSLLPGKGRSEHTS